MEKLIFNGVIEKRSLGGCNYAEFWRMLGFGSQDSIDTGKEGNRGLREITALVTFLEHKLLE